ncbi:MAG: type II secretion system protein [Verrucomicrobiota bacterium]
MKIVGNRQQAAFTLLEVLAGVAIVSLLIGGLFAVANGALDLSVHVSKERKHEARIMNLRNTLRAEFASLPASAKVEISGSELAISDAPGFLTWGTLGRFAETVRLGLLGQNLVIHHEGNQQLLASLDLIRDVDSLNWEALDSESGIWVGVWQNSEGSQNPKLIRLHYQLAHDGVARTETFRIPKYISLDEPAES